MIGSRAQLLLTLPCRHGLITFPRHDLIIGKSLQTYGEWAQSELDLLLELLPEGGTVIDAGAFVGTHTLAFATRVGEHGRVIAVEGQPSIRTLLQQNVEQNHAGQVVEVASHAVGRQPGILRFARLDLATEANFAGVRAAEEGGNPAGEGDLIEVEATTVDDLVVDRVDLIKADVEGMEVQVLEGGERTLAAHRPHLYLKCTSVSNGLRILDFLHTHGYRVFLHRAAVFNPNNFFGNQTRIFGLARETNLLGIADEKIVDVQQLLARRPDLVPVTNLDELAVLLVSTARWGEPEWSTLTNSELIARITHLLEDQNHLEDLIRAARRDREASASDADTVRDELATLRQQLFSERDRARVDAEDSKHRLAAVTESMRAEIDSLKAQRDAEAREAQLRIESLRRQISRLTRNCDRLELAEQAAASRRQEAEGRAARLEAELGTLRASREEEYLGVLQGARELEADESRLRARFDPLEPVVATPDRVRDGRVLAAGGNSAELAANQSPHTGAAALEAVPLPAKSIVQRLFDARYYLAANPGVQCGGAEDLLQHFLESGGFLGRDPLPIFDSSFYLERNPDVRAGGMNPLLHYVLEGAREGRDPHPLFSTSHYLDQAPQSTDRTTNPLLHFITEGFRVGLDPHPLFHTRFYLEQAPECLANGVDPLTHYVTFGAWHEIDPHELFDSSFYLSRHPLLRASGPDPLSHYLLQRTAKGADPHPLFSNRYYLSEAPGLDPAKVSPLVHFATQGKRQGRLPQGLFDLGRDKFSVTELDELRHDGRRVVLFVGSSVGAEMETIRNLVDVVRDRCVVLHLRPADPHLFGDGTQGLVALSPLSDEGPGLLFDPRQQLSKMMAVLRGVGVTRVHVHDSMGHETYLRELLSALALPFDVSLHDYRLLAPTPSLSGADGEFLGEPDERSSSRFRRAHNAITSLAAWRQRFDWLVNGAERAFAPSADAARRFARYFPEGRWLPVACPEPVAFDPLDVRLPGYQGDRPLRVAVLGALLAHEGVAVVSGSARRSAAKHLPLELHLVGPRPPHPETSGLAVHAAHSRRQIDVVLRDLAPDVIWLPSRWPDPYSYALSSALRAKLPTVVPSLGAFPERVGRRPWTWVVRWDLTEKAFCRFFCDLRDQLLSDQPPPLPPVLETAVDHFYPDRYLAAEGLS